MVHPGLASERQVAAGKVESARRVPGARFLYPAQNFGPVVEAETVCPHLLHRPRRRGHYSKTSPEGAGGQTQDQQLEAGRQALDRHGASTSFRLNALDVADRIRATLSELSKTGCRWASSTALVMTTHALHSRVWPRSFTTPCVSRNPWSPRWCCCSCKMEAAAVTPH